MNTANLQMEGMIMALAAIAEIVVRKGLASHAEVEKALACVEDGLLLDRSAGLSEANRAAKAFPVRMLRLANSASQRGEQRSFAQFAGMIGRTATVSGAADAPQVEKAATSNEGRSPND